MPQISVIVPVYKVEPYLHRCVDSILAQSFADFELILVDDGSPDNCGAICDDYAQKDPRITVIHQENGGLSAARNTAIDWTFANSDSQWLTFIDSDDWIHPDYLQRLLDTALTHHVSVSICDYEITTGETPVVASDHLDATLWSPEKLFVEHNVTATTAWSKLYRKECFDTIRYPVGRLHEDEFTTYKILFELPKVAYIPAPMYCYYTNTDGITKSGQSRFREDRFLCIEEQIAYFRDNGFSVACRNRIRAYLTMVQDQIDKLTSDESNPEYLAKVKARKRRYFKEYARLLSPEDPKEGWLLTRIYPRRMKIYWYSRAISQKLKKLLHLQKK